MMNKDILRKIRIFKDIGEESIDSIINCSKIIELPKKTLIIRIREKPDFIYIQFSGKSIEYEITHNGKRKILLVLGHGDLLNGNVFNNKTSSMYCETIEKSEILMIPLKEFNKIMSCDFELTKNVLILQEQKIWKLSRHLKNTSSSISLEKRLIAKLWKLSKDYGKDISDGREIDMNLSITLLADMLGAPRESVSRICSDLVENGLIKINKKRFIIINSDDIETYYKIDKKINNKKMKTVS